MNARRLMTRGAIVLSIVLVTGARPECDRRVAGDPCPAPDIVVAPGTCTEIDNPCGGDWNDLFTLSFVEGGAGMWFDIERRSSGVTVRVCAADTVGLTRGRSATVRVVDTDGTIHDAATTVATIPPLTAYVTAEPETVTALDTLRLTAHVSGGVPPYTYEWLTLCSDGDIIGDNTAPSVLAYASCETFYLFVKDAYGGATSVEKDVPTYCGVTVTATPSTIDPGGQSQLEAHVTGGEIARSWAWSPSTGLDNPNWTFTVARPTVTTRYTFRVITERGLESSASVLVTVRQ